MNGDGVVNCADLAIVTASTGKRTGQAGFDPRADLNGDGIVRSARFDDRSPGRCTVGTKVSVRQNIGYFARDLAGGRTQEPLI